MPPGAAASSSTRLDAADARHRLERPLADLVEVERGGQFALGALGADHGLGRLDGLGELAHRLLHARGERPDRLGDPFVVGGAGAPDDDRRHEGSQKHETESPDGEIDVHRSQITVVAPAAGS